MSKPYLSDSENLFTGKWTVLGFSLYYPQTGWGPMKHYPPEDMVWEFKFEEPLSYPAARRLAAYTGKLTKYSVGGRKTVRYTYYPAHRQLFFDASPIAPEGYWNRYRVEKTSHNEYWLHDLENEEALGDGTFLRLKVRKL